MPHIASPSWLSQETSSNYDFDPESDPISMAWAQHQCGRLWPRAGTLECLWHNLSNSVPKCTLGTSGCKLRMGAGMCKHVFLAECIFMDVGQAGRLCRFCHGDHSTHRWQDFCDDVSWLALLRTPCGCPQPYYPHWHKCMLARGTVHGLQAGDCVSKIENGRKVS